MVWEGVGRKQDLPCTPLLLLLVLALPSLLVVDLP